MSFIDKLNINPGDKLDMNPSLPDWLENLTVLTVEGQSKIPVETGGGYPDSYWRETPKGMSRNVWFIAIAAVLVIGGYLLYRK